MPFLQSSACRSDICLTICKCPRIASCRLFCRCIRIHPQDPRIRNRIFVNSSIFCCSAPNPAIYGDPQDGHCFISGIRYSRSNDRPDGSSRAVSGKHHNAGQVHRLSAGTTGNKIEEATLPFIKSIACFRHVRVSLSILVSNDRPNTDVLPTCISARIIKRSVPSAGYFPATAR